MIKYFLIWDFRGACSYVETLMGYMLISLNAEGVHGKQKVGNPCSNATKFKPNYKYQYKSGLQHFQNVKLLYIWVINVSWQSSLRTNSATLAEL